MVAFTCHPVELQYGGKECASRLNSYIYIYFFFETCNLFFTFPFSSSRVSFSRCKMIDKRMWASQTPLRHFKARTTEMWIFLFCLCRIYFLFRESSS